MEELRRRRRSKDRRTDITEYLSILQSLQDKQTVSNEDMSLLLDVYRNFSLVAEDVKVDGENLSSFVAQHEQQFQLAYFVLTLVYKWVGSFSYDSTETVFRWNVMENAVQVLKDPRTSKTPLEDKLDFLKEKGVSSMELQHACKQAGVDLPTRFMATSTKSQGERLRQRLLEVAPSFLLMPLSEQDISSKVETLLQRGLTENEVKKIMQELNFDPIDSFPAPRPRPALIARGVQLLTKTKEEMRDHAWTSFEQVHALRESGLSEQEVSTAFQEAHLAVPKHLLISSSEVAPRNASATPPQVSNAVREAVSFLLDPKVRNQSIPRKQLFLRQKGLNDEDISQAFDLANAKSQEEAAAPTSKMPQSSASASGKDMVDKASIFLRDPQVGRRAWKWKIDYLVRKGLKASQIEEAFATAHQRLPVQAQRYLEQLNDRREDSLYTGLEVREVSAVQERPDVNALSAEVQHVALFIANTHRHRSFCHLSTGTKASVAILCLLLHGFPSTLIVAAATELGFNTTYSFICRLLSETALDLKRVWNVLEAISSPGFSTWNASRRLGILQSKGFKPAELQLVFEMVGMKELAADSTAEDQLSSSQTLDSECRTKLCARMLCVESLHGLHSTAVAEVTRVHKVYEKAVQLGIEKQEFIRAHDRLSQTDEQTVASNRSILEDLRGSLSTNRKQELVRQAMKILFDQQTKAPAHSVFQSCIDLGFETHEIIEIGERSNLDFSLVSLPYRSFEGLDRLRKLPLVPSWIEQLQGSSEMNQEVNLVLFHELTNLVTDSMMKLSEVLVQTISCQSPARLGSLVSYTNSLLALAYSLQRVVALDTLFPEVIGAAIIFSSRVKEKLIYCVCSQHLDLFGCWEPASAERLFSSETLTIARTITKNLCDAFAESIARSHQVFNVYFCSDQDLSKMMLKRLRLFCLMLCCGKLGGTIDAVNGFDIGAGLEVCRSFHAKFVPVSSLLPEEFCLVPFLNVMRRALFLSLDEKSFAINGTSVEEMSTVDLVQVCCSFFILTGVFRGGSESSFAPNLTVMPVEIVNTVFESWATQLLEKLRPILYDDKQLFEDQSYFIHRKLASICGAALLYMNPYLPIDTSPAYHQLLLLALFGEMLPSENYGLLFQTAQLPSDAFVRPSMLSTMDDLLQHESFASKAATTTLFQITPTAVKLVVDYYQSRLDCGFDASFDIDRIKGRHPSLTQDFKMENAQLLLEDVYFSISVINAFCRRLWGLLYWNHGFSSVFAEFVYPYAFGDRPRELPAELRVIGAHDPSSLEKKLGKLAPYGQFFFICAQVVLMLSKVLHECLDRLVVEGDRRFIEATLLTCDSLACCRLFHSGTDEYAELLSLLDTHLQQATKERASAFKELRVAGICALLSPANEAQFHEEPRKADYVTASRLHFVMSRAGPMIRSVLQEVLCKEAKDPSVALQMHASLSFLSTLHEFLDILQFQNDDKPTVLLTLFSSLFSFAASAGIPALNSTAVSLFIGVLSDVEISLKSEESEDRLCISKTVFGKLMSSQGIGFIQNYESTMSLYDLTMALSKVVHLSNALPCRFSQTLQVDIDQALAALTKRMPKDSKDAMQLRFRLLQIYHLTSLRIILSHLREEIHSEGYEKATASELLEAITACKDSRRRTVLSLWWFKEFKELKALARL